MLVPCPSPRHRQHVPLHLWQAPQAHRADVAWLQDGAGKGDAYGTAAQNPSPEESLSPLELHSQDTPFVSTASSCA